MTAAPIPAVQKRFYRPELDALRLFAFASVFLVHGPRFLGNAGWKVAYNRYAKAGETGLCLFFFLSSYLITELLIRERERTGTIHLGSFYARRILRIWPLYYLGVALAVMWGLRYPHFQLSATQIAELILLVGWMGKLLAYNPFGVLWSISVEELFYAMWPWFAKRGHVLAVSLLIIPLALLVAAHQANSDTWYNPAVHFLYFATGALVAIYFHGKDWRCKLAWRAVLLSFCLADWLLMYSPLVSSWPIRYFLGDVGCVMAFLAFLQIPLRIPEPILYLGKISYGLYVFHNGCLFLTNGILIRMHMNAEVDVLRFCLFNVIALAMTISVAAISYRFYETPFLQWKRRFEYIGTRSELACKRV